LVDIRFYQQLSADCVEAGTAKRAGVQTIGMSLAHMKDSADPRVISPMSWSFPTGVPMITIMTSRST